MALIVGLVVGAALVALFFLYIAPMALVNAGAQVGVEIGYLLMVAMRLRGVNPHTVLQPVIRAARQGVRVGLDDAEGHVLAGGDLDLLASALINASKRGLAISFARAAAFQLAGAEEFQRLLNPPSQEDVVNSRKADGPE